MTTAFVAAVFALLGVGLGAWLNSLFATRKERWEFKRDLYLRLLEHLNEASALLRELILSPDRRDKFPAFSAAAQQIRRARAVTALVLDPKTSLALDHLSSTWTNLRDVVEDTERVLQLRGQALASAYDAVLVSARRDLGL